MYHLLKSVFTLIMVVFFCFTTSIVFAEESKSLLSVTPRIRDYAQKTVKPILDTHSKRDKLSLLIKVSEILLDPEIGIHKNEIKVDTFMIYDKLETVKLGFLATLGLSGEQKKIVSEWRIKFMKDHPANVLFAPSANDLIITKAAFGCTHYARSFIAVVKSLGLITKPEDLRYVISSKSDSYNQAFDSQDIEKTINGHQFVMVYIDSKWIAINTSKSEWIEMPVNFSPDSVHPPQNIPIQFESYVDVTFLLRKVGKDFNDDCDDNTLRALMNISRSGQNEQPGFKWKRFGDNFN